MRRAPEGRHPIRKRNRAKVVGYYSIEPVQVYYYSEGAMIDGRLIARARTPVEGGRRENSRALSVLALTLYPPPAAAVFRFAPLGAGDFGLALAAGIAGILWSEA